MSGIITFQLCLISHIWIIFVLLKSCHGQITNSRCESSRSHSDDRSQTPLSPVLRSETTERKKNRAESEDERAPTLQNTTEIVRNVSYVLPPSDSLSATSLLLSPPSPPSSLHPRLDSAQLFSLKRHSNDQSEKITPQREQLVKYPSSLSSLKHLSKGQ